MNRRESVIAVAVSLLTGLVMGVCVVVPFSGLSISSIFTPRLHTKVGGAGVATDTAEPLKESMAPSPTAETPTNTPTQTDTPTNTPTPTETPANTPTATEVPTNTPTPTSVNEPGGTVIPSYLYPAPRLRSPADGSDFKGDETILLIWDTPTPLSEDQWYEVQLWREGEVSRRVAQRVKEGTWKVEPRYYPGRYQWRILIMQNGQRAVNLSPPSQTWSFSWLRPSVPVSTAVPTSTSPPLSAAPVDLTVYLQGTNNAQRFAAFELSGEHVDAGTIYNEGGTVYGSVAVQIGDKVYHYDQDLASGELEPLPAPYRLEFEFSDSLIAATGHMDPGADPQKAQFWVGTLDCESAMPPDNKPYRIEMTLCAGEEIRKHSAVSFLVADDLFCGIGVSEPEGGGDGGEEPPVRP